MGESCSFGHCMFPARNLHCLIRAHLAKRGGRKSHVRISPDDVPGYIAALREANSSGDGQSKRIPSAVCRPKGPARETKHADGHSETHPLVITNRAVGEVHSDFVHIGFEALKSDLANLVSGSDACAVPKGGDVFTRWLYKSSLPERKVSSHYGGVDRSLNCTATLNHGLCSTWINQAMISQMTQ